MYAFKISEHLQDLMKRLSKKDRKIHGQVLAKINEIINSSDVEHYKI